MSKWTDSDTSSFSGDSNHKVRAAEHDAREHATKSGVFERGNDSKNSKTFSKNTKDGKRAQSFFKSLFGKE